METWKGESVGGIEREIGRVFALCVGAAAGRVRFGIACLADTVLIGTERWRRKENGRGGCRRRERGVSRLRRRKVSGYCGVVIGNRKRKGGDEWGGELFSKGEGPGKDPHVRFVDSRVRIICTYANLGDDMNSGLTFI